MNLGDSNNVVIQAEARDNTGSKPALRKVRQSGLIPGVLYAKGKSVHIAVAATHLPKEHTRSSVIKLSLSGSEKLVVMREVQVNPLNDKPIHFDFQEVSPTDKIRIHVPIKYSGLTREQEKEGSFTIHVRYLEVKGLVSEIPKEIQANVSALKGGESLQLSSLDLPKNLRIITGKGKDVALSSIVKT